MVKTTKEDNNDRRLQRRKDTPRAPLDHNNDYWVNENEILFLTGEDGEDEIRSPKSSVRPRPQNIDFFFTCVIEKVP